MVAYWLKVTSIICLWLATLVRLPYAVRHREQSALWAAVAMIAVVLTLYTKDVSDALSTIAPAYVIYLGTHLITVVLGTIVLYWFSSQPTAADSGACSTRWRSSPSFFSRRCISPRGTYGLLRRLTSRSATGWSWQASAPAQ